MNMNDITYTPSEEVELALLRQRVNELTQQVTTFTQGAAALQVHEDERIAELVRESEVKYRSLIDSMQDAVFVIQDGRFTFVNRALTTMLGHSMDELLGMPFPQVIAPEDVALVAERYTRRQKGQAVPEEYEIQLLHKDGVTRIDGSVSVRAITYQGSVSSLGTVKDITARKRAEAERMRLQEELIRAQAAALAELSTPLIPLTEDVVVMPLIGSVDSTRAQRILETLLQGVAAHRAAAVIIDITGVPVVDTHVASALLQATQAVKLLGARVILTGIRPEVAQTIVGLGIELRGIVTHSSLQSGVAAVLRSKRA